MKHLPTAFDTLLPTHPRETPMKKSFFVSTSVYALAHQLSSMQAALVEVSRQLDAPGKDSLPVVRTITRLRNLEAELMLHVDGGATYIGQARSRAFHEALKSGLPWISIDDDIDVTTACAAAMLDAIDDPIAPRIVVTPYYTRDNDAPMLTMTLPLVRSETVRNGARLLQLPPGSGGGFGFVGINRPAMVAIAEYAETIRASRVSESDLSWFDHGERKLAIFYESLEDGLWYGEDTSFFRYRIPPGVTVEALLVGVVVHAGVPLDLGKL